jgi:hypothetical protein
LATGFSRNYIDAVVSFARCSFWGQNLQAPPPVLYWDSRCCWG